MTWSYTFHRFEDRTAFEAAMIDLGWDDGAPPHHVSVDEVGILYEGDAALSGWHVNVAWCAAPPPAAFADTQIYPETPARMFAGVEMQAGRVRLERLDLAEPGLRHLLRHRRELIPDNQE